MSWRRPWKWVSSALVWLYRNTGGRFHGRLFGLPVLLLSHSGRKSGRQLTTPIFYAMDGADYIVVATNFGSESHPAWYLNLRADPNTWIQIGARRIAVRVSEVPPGQEKDRLFALLGDRYRRIYRYRERTQREVPVLRLTPSA